MPEDRHSWTSSQMPVHRVGGYAEMRACPSSSAVTTSMEKQYLRAELTALPTRVAILLRLATEVSRPSKSSSSGHVNPSKAMWSRMTSTHLYPQPHATSRSRSESGTAMPRSLSMLRAS